MDSMDVFDRVKSVTRKRAKPIEDRLLQEESLASRFKQIEWHFKELSWNDKFNFGAGQNQFPDRFQYHVAHLSYPCKVCYG